MRFKNSSQRKAVMAKIKAKKFNFPYQSPSQTGEIWVVKDTEGDVLCSFHNFDDAMKCRQIAQRKEDIKARAIEFMVKRFGENSLYDKSYVNEWISRFKTGVPENYMDSESRKIYEKMRRIR